MTKKTTPKKQTKSKGGMRETRTGLKGMPPSSSDAEPPKHSYAMEAALAAVEAMTKVNKH